MATLIITAMLATLTNGGSEMMSSSNRQEDSTSERNIADLFRKAGWSVVDQVNGPDLLIRKGNVAYAVEVKRSSEGRADRLVPLMAQAILLARSYAQSIADAAPLAIVTAPRVPLRVVHQLRDFALAHAPDVAVGIVDSRGLRDFSGVELDHLSERPLSSMSREPAFDLKAVELFSDLHQWLIKTILAPYLGDPKLLNAPVRLYSNASELALAARVSVMTAFRFLRQLRLDGFLHESSPVIRLVRLDELFRRWQAAAGRPTPQTAARWLLPGDRRVQIERAIKPLGEEACVGSFAAADALRLGVVRGVATHLYVRRLLMSATSRMGLIRAPQRAAAEVIIKVPWARESVFRGAVNADGIRSSDVLQVWLDVHDEPSRGKEQADLIFRRVIAPMLKRANHAS
jgi:Holliday junction resolvase